MTKLDKVSNATNCKSKSTLRIYPKGSSKTETETETKATTETETATQTEKAASVKKR